MKNLLLTYILFFTGLNMIWAQDVNISVGGNYYLNPSTDIDKMEITGNTLIAEGFFKGRSYILEVQAIQNGEVYFKFWPFKNDSLNNKINGEQNGFIYKISTTNFKNLATPYYDKFEWRIGIYTVPYKLRFDQFEFESNLSIGTNLGLKIRFNRKEKTSFAIEPLLGFGLTSIKLNEYNSDISSSSNIAAFTINTGVVFHITSKINLGILLGADLISGKDQEKYHWTYHGKPWVGLGFNIAFSRKNNHNSKPQKNE